MNERRKKKKRKRKKGKKQEKDVLIEEFSINVYRRKGIIFSARRTTDSPPASTMLTDSLRPCFFVSSRPPTFHHGNFQLSDCFCTEFLAVRLLIVLDVLVGIDNVGELGIRTSIIARCKYVWSTPVSRVEKRVAISHA